MGSTSVLIDLELWDYLRQKSRAHESRNATLRRLLGLPPKPDMRRRENKSKNSGKNKEFD